MEKYLRRSLFVALAACAVGMLISLLIFYFHDLSQNQAFCSASGLISCEALANPKYSKVFDIPLSLYAFLFYAFAFSTIAVVMKKRGTYSGLPLIFYLSCISLVPTLILASIVIFEIKSLCPYCLGLYAVSLMFWISVFLAWKKSNRSGDKMVSSIVKSLSPWMAGYMIASIAALAAYSIYGKKATLTGTAKSLSQSANENLRTLGVETSAHTIVKFSDFQCPMCKTAAGLLKDLEKEERGNVKIIYKFYPLDNACNRALKRKMHPDSCNAAKASYCASLQNQFWAYHDLVFENQKELPLSLLNEFAKMLNLDMAQFDQCLQDADTMRVIQANLSEGDDLGVQGTPSLFIDGRQYHGEISLNGLRSALRQN